jgi:DNA-binding PadR family transcriptional regulator
MRQLTAFQRDILYVISDQDSPYGLAIKRGLEDYYGEEVNHGRLYPNLDALAERGLLKKGTIDDRTNSYELTDAAHELLAERRQWENDHVDLVERRDAVVDSADCIS